MESLNVRLWNALCKLVGTKEEIFIKRRVCHFKNIVDNVCHDGNTTLVFSGSKAEGLDLEGSDYDYMFIRKDISVLPPNSANDDSCDIVMETINVKPGFVRLRCKYGISDIASALTETSDSLYLSSLLFRDIVVSRYKSSIPNIIAHGPCASYTSKRNHEFDLLECLSSKAWPDITSEWIGRQRRNNWPSHTLIKDIIDGGCLVVPIGDPNSQHNFMEWRISFSMPEKKLIYSMNHTQFLCYALLKLYLKHVINSNNEVKDLLCSYFLKTSLFYCMEDENISWTKENLFDCFLVCLRRIIYWVRIGYCPNFFIKANNMFQGKIFGEKQRILLNYLSDIYHDGVIRLRAISCLTNIFDGTILPMLPSEGMCDIALSSAAPCIWYSLVFSNKYDCFMVMNFISKLQYQTLSNVDRAIVTFHLNAAMMVFVQQLYRQTLNHRSNKICYKEIQKLKRYIIQNCMNRDECTAKLLLATLCYLNGEYKEVVTIVDEVLNVHGRYMTMLFDDRNDDEMCGKGLTMHQKMQLGLFCDLFYCYPDCGFYPPEVELELMCHSEDGLILIPTIIYTRLLLFLSHHHLRCKQKVNYTLNELYMAVQRKLYSDEDRPLTMSLLEKCLQLAETHQQEYV